MRRVALLHRAVGVQRQPVPFAETRLDDVSDDGAGGAGGGPDERATLQPMADVQEQDMMRAPDHPWAEADADLPGVGAMEKTIKSLEEDFRSGRMLAFGSQTDQVFEHLRRIREQQNRLFTTHAQMEKSLGEEHAAADGPRTESDRFDNNDFVAVTEDMFSDMAALGDEVSEFAKSFADMRSDPARVPQQPA